MSLIKLDRFEFVWEAELVRGLLESEGIQAFVFDAEHVRMLWPLSGALGGVKVMINKHDLTRAQEVISNWQAGKYENHCTTNQDVINAEGNTLINWEIKQCAKCSSKNLSPIYNSFFTLIFFLFIGPAPGKAIGKKCRDCSHKNLYE